MLQVVAWYQAPLDMDNLRVSVSLGGVATAETNRARCITTTQQAARELQGGQERVDVQE